MIPHMVPSLLVVCLFTLSGALAWAGEVGPHAYSLSDILTFAAQHNPVLAGAEGLVKQSQGQQMAAGAYRILPSPGLPDAARFVTPVPAPTSPSGH